MSTTGVKLSPLSLLVRIGGPPSFKITINGKDAGTAADPFPLGSYLRDVFKVRQEMGVFKPGTNEPERTVIVKADRSVSYGDYVGVIKLIQDAGAEPLGISTDEKKVPLDPSAEPEVSRREIPLDNQEVPRPEAESEQQVTTVRELVAYPGFNAVVKRVMQGEAIDPSNVGKSSAVVEVKANGVYLLNGQQVEKASLFQRLNQRFKETPEEERITYIVADKNLQYGNVEDAINEVWEVNNVVVLVASSAVEGPYGGSPATGATNWIQIIIVAAGAIALLGVVWFVIARERNR